MKPLKRILFLLVLLFTHYILFAQTNQVKITVDWENMSYENNSEFRVYKTENNQSIDKKVVIN